MTRKPRQDTATAADTATADTTPAESTPTQAGQTCPWCSAQAPLGATTCPSCHAALRSQVDDGSPEIPGVTSIDPELLAYKPSPRKPQRLVDTLIKLLDEDQEQILAGLYPDQEEEGKRDSGNETKPPEGNA